MKTYKYSLDRFYKIIERTDFKGRCISEKETDEFVRHLMYDELPLQERWLVEEHRLYDWLFQHYYTEEEKHILKLFSQMVSERKTVIYGTGLIARFLLNCGFYKQIAGVMARIKPGKSFCGKKIMSERQILENGITQIVLAAKVSNYQVIKERIADFCEKNGILLQGLNGRNLLQWYDVKGLRYDRTDRRYFSMGYESLQAEIDNHDIISFDVFDTLVMRKVLYPEDVFNIVGYKTGRKDISPEIFVEKRKYADRHNKHEKNIFGIYRTMQGILGLTDKERDRFMELEIETEKRLIICRKEVVRAYQYALLQGKKVFLISNMHLPESIMREILSGVGIEGYEKLLVSCDYCCDKMSGLFHIYREMVPKGRCLHIGDDEVMDYAASKEGIDVFLIRSAIKLLKTSNLKTLTGYAYSMKEKNALGLFLSEVFNDPFALQAGCGMICVRTYKEWGHHFLGIYVVAYFDWLIRKLKESQIEKMLFSTRDGYLFYNLYEWYRENIDKNIPKAVYFKTSRKLCYLASMSNEESIDFYLKYDNVYAPDELLEKRFLFEKNDILPYSGEDRREYIMKHKEKIFWKSEIIRDAYLSYMNDIGLQENKKYGFFDSYCRGSVQYLMEQFVPFELQGLYQGKIHNTFELKKIQSFYEDEGNYLKLNDINEKRTLMEYCFSSPETNIIGMNGNGEFMYAKEYRTEKDIKHMLDIQEGIRDFFVEYYKAFPLGAEEFKGDLSNAIINAMDFVDLAGECHDMDTIRSIDDMVNKGYAVWEN